MLDLCCCTRAFLLLWQAGATFHCSMKASHCHCFFCCRAQALGPKSFSSCGAQDQILCSMLAPLQPGIEPVSPALAGLWTTRPPGKPLSWYFWNETVLGQERYIPSYYTVALTSQFYSQQQLRPTSFKILETGTYLEVSPKLPTLLQPLVSSGSLYKARSWP